MFEDNSSVHVCNSAARKLTLQILEDHVKIAESITKTFHIKVGQRRTHALLGQTILQRNPNIQTGNIWMMLPDDFDYGKLGYFFDKCRTERIVFLEANDKFQSLSDEDHDGDEPDIDVDDGGEHDAFGH